jgi:glutamate racemase
LSVIREVIGPNVVIVDSAATTAQTARRELEARGLLREVAAGAAAPQAGGLSFLATDATAQFAQVGGRFLARRIAPEAVALIDL